MKRFVVAMFVMAFALGAAFGQQTTITHTDNPHNLAFGSSGAAAAAGTEICVFCHTPHQSGTTLDPLWNHTLSGASYTMYTSTTLNAIPGVIDGESSLTNMCLSCHDGTIAVSSMYNDPNSGAYAMTEVGVIGVGGVLIGTPLVGVDLSNDHPINMDYGVAVTAGDDLETLPLSLPLYGSTVQCATCHEVHSNEFTAFLRMSNANSNLCRDCHTK